MNRGADCDVDSPWETGRGGAAFERFDSTRKRAGVDFVDVRIVAGEWKGMNEAGDDYAGDYKKARRRRGSRDASAGGDAAISSGLVRREAVHRLAVSEPAVLPRQ